MKAEFKCAVHMIIKKDNRVLVQKRKDTELWPGYYSLPAGHLDQGENQYEALVREAKEELGIIVDPKDITDSHVVLMNNHFKVNGKIIDPYIVYYFEFEKYKGIPENMEEDKCEELMWIDLNDLPEPFVNYQGDFLDDKTMTYYECETEGAYQKNNKKS